MSKKTVNYNLIKPEANDNYDIEDQNKNMDVIDGELKAINDFREGVVKFPKASGTGVLIVVTTGLFKLEDGNTITFIAHEDNEGSTTTLNVDDKGAKPIYKPGTVVAPNIKAGKAITVWYDLEHECFFIKASAEGNATAENVLAEKKFSNDDDTGLVGSMPNIGNIGVSELKNQGQEYDIPKGYHDGQGKVRADITNLTSSVIKSGSTVGGVQGTFTSDANAQSNHMLSGVTAYVGGSKVTGTIPSISAQTITPSTVNKTIASGQYLSGTQTIAGDADLISANIKAGKNIFGVTGSANVVDTSAGDATAGQILSGKKAYVDGALVTGTIPSITAQTITPSTVNKTIAAGQYLSGTQTIAGDADLISANIKSGKNIFGVAGNANVVDTSAGDATAGQILSGKKAYVDGALVTGTIPSIAAKTYTPSRVSQTIPAGKYLSGTQTIVGDADLISSNIKAGKNIFGVAGSAPNITTSTSEPAGGYNGDFWIQTFPDSTIAKGIWKNTSGTWKQIFKQYLHLYDGNYGTFPDIPVNCVTRPYKEIVASRYKLRSSVYNYPLVFDLSSAGLAGIYKGIKIEFYEYTYGLIVCYEDGSQADVTVNNSTFAYTPANKKIVRIEFPSKTWVHENHNTGKETTYYDSSAILDLKLE